MAHINLPVNAAIVPNEDGGYVAGNYSWSQTLGEVEVEITLNRPRKLRLRDFTIRISKRHLYIGLKGEPPILDGILCEEVLPEECVTLFEKENVLIVLLAKANPNEYWRNVIKSEPPINIAGIPIERARLGEVERVVRQKVNGILAERNIP